MTFVDLSPQTESARLDTYSIRRVIESAGKIILQGKFTATNGTMAEKSSGIFFWRERGLEATFEAVVEPGYGGSLMYFAQEGLKEAKIATVRRKIASLCLLSSSSLK